MEFRRVLFRSIDARAASLAAEAGSPARTALLAQKSELSDRPWLAGVKADVLAEIERRKLIARFEEAQRATLTNSITPKSKETAQADRKGVGAGKSVAVRVVIGGGSNNKK